MVGALSALIEPVARALLKAWLGDAVGEIGGGLVKFARDVLQDGRKATAAAKHVRTMAARVTRDLETAMKYEDLDEDVTEAAAAELAETIQRHVSTGWLLEAGLKPEAVEK